MYKVAAIGDRDSVYGYSAVGLTVFFTDDAHEAKLTLRKLSESGFAVVFITEQLLAKIPEEYERYKSQPLPAIIPIPGAKGNTGFGLKNVGRFVEQAVGSDIIS